MACETTDFVQKIREFCDLYTEIVKLGLEALRATTYDCAHVRTRMRIFILVLKRSILSSIDIEGCGLRDQRCCNVHPASYDQLAKETRYSRGSFARNSSRQKTPTTESPPSVKQSRTTSNPERCSFVAFEPPKVSLRYLSISIFYRTLLTRLLLSVD